MRNRRNFTLKYLWEGTSWRYFKFHALIEQEKQNSVLSWVPYGPDALNENDAKLVLNFLSTFECTYLCASSHSWADRKGIGVIRPLVPSGVLRDLLHKVYTFLTKK